MDECGYREYKSPRMAILYFIDKESGEPGTLGAPEAGLKWVGACSVNLGGEMSGFNTTFCQNFGVPPALPKAAKSL